MRANLSDQTYHLAPHQLLRLERVRGWRLVCLHGQLWITCQGDPLDYQLQPGEQLVLDCGGVVLVEAMLPGSVQLHVPRAGLPRAQNLTLAAFGLNRNKGSHDTR